MDCDETSAETVLLDECGPSTFRAAFGAALSRSSEVETAILRVRLSGVDLSKQEIRPIKALRVMVAEVSARRVEEEAFAMAVDPVKRENLDRILGLLHSGILEIRSAPLGSWSPDFTVFSQAGTPWCVLLGLHVFSRPFPHRGPTWAARFGAREATLAHKRFQESWDQAHDIGEAICRLMEAPGRR